MTKYPIVHAMQRILVTVTILCIVLVFATSESSRARPTLAVTWPPLPVAGQSATRLPDGQWLLLGGEGELGNQAQLVRQNSAPVLLSAQLLHPRSSHTATLLPDGRVLVLGGCDAAGVPFAAAEVFDPTTLRFARQPIDGLLPRASHSATILSDGRVLLAGGVGVRFSPILETELWNPVNGDVERFHARIQSGRLRHQAALLPTGDVLLWGGLGTNGAPAEAAEVFEFDTGEFRRLSAVDAQQLTQNLDGSQLPAVQSSVPAAEAMGFSGLDPLVVKFNKRMALTTLSSQSITLVGPTGPEPTRVVPVEQGMLVFVWPIKELLPASRYTLFINGVTDNAQHPLSLSAIGFDTSAKAADLSGMAALEAMLGAGDPIFATTPSDSQSSDLTAQFAKLNSEERYALQQQEKVSVSEDWLPGMEHFQGRWHAGRVKSALETLPPLRAPAGITALSGHVLGMNGRALPGVTMRVGNQEVRTDVTGRFLMQDLEPGFAKMEIDGVSANRPGSRYGYYAARIELRPRETTVVPYVIWMPRLDPAGTVRISAPTTSETIVTSPRIPGLELHIPAGTVIRDRDGRIVTELNITAIPVDRPPFPVPDLGVPVYFTVQPGGAVLQSVTSAAGPGARLFYPNFKGEVPGAQGVFWDYDADNREWFVYGLGTIDASGKQAIPDAGVEIHQFTGAMFNGSNAPGGNGPPPCGCGGSGGDPVSLYTGQFDQTTHDLVISDVMPIDIARTYRSSDRNQRAFGIGMTYAYDVFLFSQNQYQEVDIILPTGTRVHYVRTSPGTGYNDAIFESLAPAPWNRSVLTRNLIRFGWDLHFQDGRKWFFRQYQPLSEISDANGNVTRIVREANDGTSGKVARIVSPNGRTVDFSYNASGFVSSIMDNLSRRVTYVYDAGNRLTEVHDPLGGIHRLSWDTTNNRIISVGDPNGVASLRNEYDEDGRVKKQIMADGSTFEFTYRGILGLTSGVDVKDQRGSVRSVNFDLLGYMRKNTFPAGTPEAQEITYEVTAGRLDAVVDSLNRRTEYQYNDAGSVSRITRLPGTDLEVSVSFSYDPVSGLPLTATDANGHTRTMGYDAFGNLVRVTNQLGQVSSITYDSQGRPQTVTDPMNRTVTFGYEGADLSMIRDPIGREMRYTSDAVGRVVASVDPMGNRSLFVWDELGHLRSATDPLGGVSRFSYDANGNVLSTTDAKGGVVGYSYNSNNQINTTNDALLRSASSLYEPGGLLRESVDRNGQLDSIAYDALGRISLLKFGATPENTAAFRSVVQYVWDRANRLTRIVERVCATPEVNANCGSVLSESVIDRTYDDLDRMIGESTSLGEVNYTYDKVGRRTSMVIRNGPAGAQIAQPAITYAYDDSGQLISVQQAPGSINAGVRQEVALSYNPAGQRVQTRLANGSTINDSYDDAGQLSALVYRKADGSLIGDLQYEYDDNGRVSSVSGSLAKLELPVGDIDATYDSGGRVLSWAGRSYVHDNNGNLTDDGNRAYRWDERGRLVQILGGANEIARFQYDSLGRRSSQTLGAATTGFLYDNANVAQELNGSVSSADVKAHLLVGGVDEVFLKLEGNTGAVQQSFLADARQHTIMLLDAAQEKIVGYAYAPYGMTTADAIAENRYQYTGRENSDPGSEEGLYYYRARYYMPELGRFISEDPIGWASGQVNRYAYVGGDPVGFRDPTGFAAQAFEDFSAGLGDIFTFGLGPILRNSLGINGVYQCSGWYTAGSVAGVVALGGGVGAASGIGAAGATGGAAITGSAAVATGGAAAVRVGQAGEAAVRSVANIGPKVLIDVAGRGRIPDGLTPTVLTEVKNVAQLSYTQQLRDYVDFSKATGRTVDLWVRGTTKLSGPLEGAVDSGDIRVKIIP